MSYVTGYIVARKIAGEIEGLFNLIKKGLGKDATDSSVSDARKRLAAVLDQLVEFGDKLGLEIQISYRIKKD